MTMFILAGGNDRTVDPSYGDRLALVVKKIVERPTILSCFLSRPDEVMHEHWLDYQPWFKEKFGDVEVLEATRDNFYELAEKADVIYLHGGHTRILLENLPDFQRSAEAFRGKIVIGSSAGANYLSTHCMSMSEGFKVIEGSGIVGQPTLVHYRTDNFYGTRYTRDDWDAAEQKLNKVDGGKNILCMPEGSFIVVTQ